MSYERRRTSAGLSEHPADLAHLDERAHRGQSVPVMHDAEAELGVDALLVVDAQVGLLEGLTAVPTAAGVLDRLENLLHAARAAGGFVVHLQNDGPAGASDEPGTAGWHIHPRASPLTDELVYRKVTDDGFAGTDLGDALAARRVRTIAIAGLLSEMCVSATARGALARGLAVVLVRDAHATYDLGDIPASTVARVAEHALSDDVRIMDAEAIVFRRPAADAS